MTIRIANAAGFWGDDLDAPRRVLAGGGIDYLTLEYLAELTMSILAHQRRRDPQAGFATDLLQVLPDLVPHLRESSGLRVVTNAGGVNPEACVRSVAERLMASGRGDLPLGIVQGDDLLPRWADLWNRGWRFPHFDTGEPWNALGPEPVSANVYLGAPAIAEALRGGAQVVITGRVADASLSLGPLVHEFGWGWTDWERLGAGTLVGHLIECGAQVTGGYSTRGNSWDLVDIGYPIAEVESTGTAVITKPTGSGGRVDRRTVIEQLLYEVGDPSRYFTPDVVANFATAVVTEMEADRVQVQGASGLPAPADYKVSVAYPAGYMASGTLLVVGPNAGDKARQVGELVWERLRRRGFPPERTQIECLGCGDGTRIGRHGTASESKLPSGLGEVLLRLSVHDPQRRTVERFAAEIAPLITNGPAGLAGYAAGRPSVRPVLAYWPTTLPRAEVAATSRVQRAAEWCR